MLADITTSLCELCMHLTVDLSALRKQYIKRLFKNIRINKLHDDEDLQLAIEMIIKNKQMICVRKHRAYR